MEDFKVVLKEYITLDAKIKQAEKTIKILKERKKFLHENIHKYMQKQQIKQINLPHGRKIKTVTKKTRPGTGKKWVEERLQEFCSMNRVNYNDIYDFIYDKEYRPEVEKEMLKTLKN